MLVHFKTWLDTSSTLLCKAKTIFITSILTLYISIGSVYADDTEIFFGSHTNPAYFSNVLFILDTSGSMDGKDGTSKSRIARMKDSVRQILDSATNINVGIMRFNGSYGGGPILYPITYIDKDLCPYGICSEDGDIVGNVPLSYRIENSSDDVTEAAADLSITKNDETLSLFKSKLSTTKDTTDIYTNSSSSDYAEQRADGISSWSNSSDLDSFYDGSQMLWGLRFHNIVIPDDATLSNAFLRFHARLINSDENKGALTYNVFMEDTLSPIYYQNKHGYRVSNRSLVPTPVEWPIDLPISSNDGILDTPDLTSALVQLTDISSFTSGQSDVGFVLKNKSYSDATHIRTLYSPGTSFSSRRPQLHVTYTTNDASTQQVGLRFNNVKIPQGATITQASITFTSESSQSSASSATIHAHDVGHSPPFTGSNGNLSSRTKTYASTNWNIPAWGSHGEQHNTDDISDVIQEVVSRSDWCGGNSLSLLLNGTGLRKALSYDYDPANAPVLKLTYDASSISSGDGCITANTVASILTGNDDVNESNTGAIIKSNNKLFIANRSGDEYLTGLRFQNIAVPKDAKITNAHLILTSMRERTDSASWTISAENSANSESFSSTTNSLSNRNKTSSTVDWDSVDTVMPDDILTSPDLKSLISAVTSNNGWASGNALSLFIEHKSGTNNRVVYSYNKQPIHAAKLSISYEVTPGNMPSDSQNQVVYLSTRQKLKQILDEMDTYGGTPIIESLYEAANYFKGKPVEFGKTRGYPDGGSSYISHRHRVSHPISYEGGSVTKDSKCKASNYSHISCDSEEIHGSPVYTSPINDSCQTNHIVLLTDGEPSSTKSLDKVKDMIGTTNCDNHGGGTCGEELLTYLRDNDHSTSVDDIQGIITHTVGFNFSSQWLEDLSVAGGGGYYTADSSSELTSAFNTILASILKVDTTFVAPSATVNQFNRLAHSDELYLSLFKPNDRPMWTGNLKKYWLKGNPAMMTDVDGNAAIDKSTGFFYEDAKSGWSKVVDGNSVELGGAASLLNASTRRVFTYTGSNELLSHSSNQLHEYNNSLSKSMFNISGQSTNYYNKLLKWSRGIDIKDADNDNSNSDTRTHMGDSLHSQPLVIAGESSTDTTIYVATNEGYLHAISQDGEERWSFIPPDLLPNLNTFYEGNLSMNHPYGLDGHLYHWIDDRTDKDYLIMGMRRGGNKYYSLDITNKDNPKMAWTIDPDTQPDFAQLGQSWAEPVSGTIKLNGVETKVLIIAGGYDTNQDSTHVRSEDSVGNIIYMINPLTGDLIWSGGGNSGNVTKKFADMRYSIPATIKAIDIDFDGFTDQMYVGDMGGQIWRFDIDNYSTNSGELVKGGVIARLSDDTITSARRFFYSPDVALIKDNHESYLSIAIGSGWRAHPLDRAVNNRFYIIRDSNIYTAPEGYGKDDGNGNYSIMTENDLIDVTNDQSPSLDGKNGFYIRLENDGEKVLAKSITLKGKTIFTTYLPDPPVATCTSALGGGFVYVINTKDGSAALDLNNSGGDDLTKDDRNSLLSHHGIPPEAVVMFPGNDSNGNAVNPTILVGSEKLFDTSSDDLTPRTFWYESHE